MKEAHNLAERMPHLVLQAKQLATLVLHGLHGKRKAGIGEEFWQFRPFISGESTQRIDWRKSARDETLYIKEQEWQVASLFHLFPDTRVSMQYGTPQKCDSAVILSLALAKCLVEAGERVTLYGVTRPTQSRNVIEELAQRLLTLDFPQTPPQKGTLVVFSDFFFDYKAFKRQSSHFLVMNDAKEYDFPFKGRVEFEELTHDEKLEFNRTQEIKSRYLERLEAHFASLKGETTLFHRTDAPMDKLLIHYLLKLAGKA